jgi:hypothetical protein
MWSRNYRFATSNEKGARNVVMVDVVEGNRCALQDQWWPLLASIAYYAARVGACQNEVTSLIIVIVSALDSPSSPIKFGESASMAKAVSLWLTLSPSNQASYFVRQITHFIAYVVR